jgi:hypothetical protein
MTKVQYLTVVLGTIGRLINIKGEYNQEEKVRAGGFRPATSED